MVKRYYTRVPISELDYKDICYVMSSQHISDSFVELDVDTLRQQIDPILDELGDYRDVEGYFRAKDRAIDAILSLVFPGIESENK